MSKEIIMTIASLDNKEIRFYIKDLISYKESSDGIDLWIKDETMFNGKRFYKSLLSIEGFELLLRDANNLSTEL